MMDKERNPEFHSVSSALVYVKRNYLMFAGPMLGVLVGSTFSEVRRMTPDSGQTFLHYAIQFVLSYLGYHVVIILAICIVGPLLDLVSGKRPHR